MARNVARVRLVLAAAAVTLLWSVMGDAPAYAGFSNPIVTSTDDPGEGTCTVQHCTLREAMTVANTSFIEKVTFDIPVSDSGYDPADQFWTIDLQSPLPNMTNDYVIEGYSQPGAQANTLGPGQGSNAQIKIYIDGVAMDPADDWAFNVATGGVRIEGLAIGRVPGFAIIVTGGTDSQIAGNFIGTDTSGATDRGNTFGVALAAAANKVGGTAPADRNVIVNNDNGPGILISASGNNVEGNLIGLGADGSSRGNQDGVLISAPGTNFVGGFSDAARNVISANQRYGVHVTGENSGNVVVGNYIGTNVSGTSARGNGQHGVYVQAPDTIVGMAGRGNIISGNGAAGVAVLDTRAVIRANRIGTNAAGTAAIPNNRGVEIGTLNLVFAGERISAIGGANAGEGNLISGNSGDGIRLLGETYFENTVQGNFIGTNAAGTAAVANGGAGIWVEESPDNIIGGITTGARNVISGNTGHGIVIRKAEASGNGVVGNYIGVGANGSTAIGNNRGINIEGSSFNAIGTHESGNVISANRLQGIVLINFGDDVPSDNFIRGNYIGVAADGSTPAGNAITGILVTAANNNSIGGIREDDRNIIAYNGNRGIIIQGTQTVATTGNTVTENSIYNNTNLGIDLVQATNSGPISSGVDVNDPGDGDAGPNGFQNYPVLATAVAGSVELTGFFDSAAGDYRIEFFANQTCDASGHGEGQTFIGAGTVTLPSSGGFPIQASLPQNVAAGSFITATATNAAGGTSEFSNCVLVQGGQTPTPTPTPPGQTPSPTQPGQTPTPTPTVTATPPGQTPTPTPTPTPTAPSATATLTPTASPDGLVLVLGDVNCSGSVDPVDALGLLRADAGLSVNKIDPACPDIGDQVSVAAIAAVPQSDSIPWGDVDCDLSVGPIDSLKVLRHDAGLNVSQQSGCPNIGEPL